MLSVRRVRGGTSGASESSSSARFQASLCVDRTGRRGEEDFVGEELGRSGGGGNAGTFEGDDGGRLAEDVCCGVPCVDIWDSRSRGVCA